MALVESHIISLGTPMPDFNLPDPFGNSVSLSQNRGQTGTLVCFTCNHCPYAIAVWPRLIEIARLYLDKGIHTIFINPNIHPDYPADSPEEMKKKVQEWQIPSPYLIDAQQSVARAYQAQCTPDIYLLDHNLSLVYHGRIDNNWKEPEKATQFDLKQALSLLIDQKPITFPQIPSMGCSIKWVSE